MSSSLEQLRDSRHGLMEKRGIFEVFRILGRKRRILLRGEAPYIPLFAHDVHYSHHKRWGDAPIHSIAVSLFASKDQIHFFKDIGYRHSPFQHCPQGSDWKKGHCSCDPNDNFGMT